MSGDDTVAVRRDDLKELAAAAHAYVAHVSRLLHTQNDRELIAKLRDVAQRADGLLR